MYNFSFCHNEDDESSNCSIHCTHYSANIVLLKQLLCKEFKQLLIRNSAGLVELHHSVAQRHATSGYKELTNKLIVTYPMSTDVVS